MVVGCQSALFDSQRWQVRLLSLGYKRMKLTGALGDRSSSTRTRARRHLVQNRTLPSTSLLSRLRRRKRGELRRVDGAGVRMAESREGRMRRGLGRGRASSSLRLR